MINIREDEINSIRYTISIEAKDGKEILLGNFLKSCDEDKDYNNVLTLYTDEYFKINTTVLSYISNIIHEKVGNMDFSIETSNIFRMWDDADRYITENIINNSPNYSEVQDISIEDSCNKLSNMFEKQNKEQAELIKKHITNLKLELNSSLMQKFDEMISAIE